MPEWSELLDARPVRVFKDDGRSKVWQAQGPDGRPWVFKRFTHAAWKQRFTARLKQHPAQRERLWHERLIDAGQPAVPIVAQGVAKNSEHWLATPMLGPSLYNWLRHCDPANDAATRHDFTRQLGTLTGQLLKMRVAHGDHKASNVLLDETRTTDAGTPTLTLIDAGACHGFKGTPLLAASLPTLQNLLHNLRDAATYHDTPQRVTPTRADMLRFFKAMAAAWPAIPDGLHHLPRHPDLK